MMADCLKPIFIAKQNISVPCRKCPNCINRATSEWTVRIIKENDFSTFPCEECQWYTLTYDTDHVPITRNTSMSLSRLDCSLFLKRLRTCVKSRHKKEGTEYRCPKFFLCGEYGSDNNRPHYHAFIWGARIAEVVKCWGKGLIHCYEDGISAEKAGYTVKYMHKQAGKFSTHWDSLREREFRMMSHNLGNDYIEFAKKWHKAIPLQRNHVPLPGNDRACMPRVWREKIFDDDEMELIRAERLKRFSQQTEELEKETQAKLDGFLASKFDGNTEHLVRYVVEKIEKMNRPDSVSRYELDESGVPTQKGLFLFFWDEHKHDIYEHQRDKMKKDIIKRDRNSKSWG